jgi:hypothetical protein
MRGYQIRVIKVFFGLVWTGYLGPTDWRRAHRVLMWSTTVKHTLFVGTFKVFSGTLVGRRGRIKLKPPLVA